MTPLNEQPTHLRVRNLLGVPDNAEKIFASLPESQQLGLALSWVAEDVNEIRKHGCEKGVNDRRRITHVEGIIKWAVGAVAGITACAGVVGFVLILVKFFGKGE